MITAKRVLKDAKNSLRRIYGLAGNNSATNQFEQLLGLKTVRNMPRDPIKLADAECVDKKPAFRNFTHVDRRE